MKIARDIPFRSLFREMHTDLRCTSIKEDLCVCVGGHPKKLVHNLTGQNHTHVKALRPENSNSNLAIGEVVG